MTGLLAGVPSQQPLNTEAPCMEDLTPDLAKQLAIVWRWPGVGSKGLGDMVNGYGILKDVLDDPRSDSAESANAGDFMI